MNRDEAARCAKIAEIEFDAGNYHKAYKFIEKARKMEATSVDEEQYNRMKDFAEKKPNTSGDSKVQEEPLQTSHQNETEESSSSPKYTQIQVNEVEKAKKCKDYYELLGLDKTATNDDLKKAYKKMALKFHPDKNQAPGATDVFKAVSNAYSVLSKPDKRLQYDTFGDTSNQAQTQSNGSFTRTTSPFAFNQYTDDDLSPEELFAQLFGTMALHSMGMGFGSFGFNGVRVFTNHNNPFFRPKGFKEEYQGTPLNKVELEIEETFLRRMQNQCYNELRTKEHLKMNSMMWGNQQSKKAAEDYQTPSCSEFHRIKNILDKIWGS